MDRPRFQQRQASNTTLLIFAASVLSVSMVLAMRYEIRSLPLSVMLVGPVEERDPDRQIRQAGAG